MVDTKKILVFLGIAVLINVIIYLFSFLIPYIENKDIQLLLFLNPDTYIPFVDELMVMVTDFSMIVFPVTYIIWVIGFLTIKKDTAKQEGISKVFKLIGVILGIGIASGYFWGGYDLPFVFPMLGTILFIIFWILGRNFKNADVENLDRMEGYVRVLGIIAIAAILTNAISESLIKEIVGRPRPLNSINSSWNTALVTRADAITKSGFSYASGHSSAMFMMMTPLMLEVKDRKKKLACFLFAALHAFTRIYLVAHFPYCTLWGSIQGFSFGVLAYKTFRQQKNK